MEAVKRQILIAIGQLNVPVNRAPTKQKIDEACSAAKLLRNRLVREHCRVVEKLSTLHQQQCYDESSDDDNWEDRMHGGQTQIKGSTSRSEFIFVCELLLTEKVIIPLLLAHGLSYPETLLPQLLKLLAALLLPVPRFSDDRILQTDCLRHIKSRCGTDEFFSLVVQCAAPIAERRSKDLLRREDAVLLEVILTLVKNLLSGKSSDSELIHGSFCRSNGVELLLVVVNQNFSKMNSFQRLNEDISTNSRNVTPKGQSPDPVHAVEKMEGNVVELSDDECSATNERQSAAESESDHDEIENKSERSSLAAQLLHQQFAERVSGLLESKTQIWKWNSLILASMSNILGCVSSSELAQLCVLTETSDGSADGLPAVLRQKAHFKECRKSSENWRNIARSRNGAVNSSGIIVKSDPTMGDTRSLGTVSSLYGTKRKDPLEIAKEMDLRKRGRFVKGMYQQDQVLSACSLPLPTKLMLSQQCQSFVCFGFEPLSSMSWNYVSEAVDEVERATKEYKELVSGYRGSGENMEVISAFDGALFEKVATALDYFRMCGTLLHYIREVAQLLPRHDERPLLTIPSFQRQWQGASSIISLDHVDGAFRLLRSILQCKDLRRRCHLGDCLEFLIEILLLLHWLLDGDMGRDPAVAGAARALASSVLYKEENIKVVFDILSEFASRNVPKNLANKCTLFTFAVLQLMDRCGYQGSLLLPKKRPNARRGGDTGVVGEAFEDDGHDGDSIDSDTLKEREAEDAAELQGMIDDDDDDDRRDPNHLSGGEEVTQAPDTEETDVKELNDSNTLFADRAVSEEHPPTVLSVATSGHTMISTGSSERTVPIGSYVRRLASAKNCTVLLATLRGWRVNEAEVNLGLTFLMERLVAEGCESVFFNFAFLLVAREVLAYGEATHGPLYRVCDRIIYDFFNPPYAHMMDNRAATNFGDDHQLFLNGAQSFLGFEVALRCARALFYCSPTDYSILEERGQPQLVEHTAIPLVSEVALAGDDVVEWLPVPPAGVDPLLEPKPKRRRRHRRSPEAAMAIEEFS